MDIHKKKKLAIIGTVGLPANYGGFETLADHLVENLGNEYETSVYCSGKKYPKEIQQKSYKGARLIYLPLEANGIQSIFYDTLSILHALFYADVLLILGVSGAWILPFIKWFTNKKILISIDGIEWKRNKWSLPAKWYLCWAESVAVKYSHFDISDNESIQDYTAKRYGSLSTVIEYGGNHTIKVVPTPEDIHNYPFIDSPYAFKVCRIEPENNVHLVLEAFTKISTYRLVIIGNWKNSLYGSQLKEKYGNHQNIILLDPIYHQRTLDLIRGNANIYVHGHSAGGTNPSLVEAMYLGLPILAYGVSYNRTTTQYKAKYFSNAEEIISGISNMTQMEWAQLGKTMAQIASKRYHWEVITSKYKFLIEQSFNTKQKINVVPTYMQLDQVELMKLQVGHLHNHHLFFEK